MPVPSKRLAQSTCRAAFVTAGAGPMCNDGSALAQKIVNRSVWYSVRVSGTLAFSEGSDSRTKWRLQTTKGIAPQSPETAIPGSSFANTKVKPGIESAAHSREHGALHRIKPTSCTMTF